MKASSEINAKAAGEKQFVGAKNASRRRYVVGEMSKFVLRKKKTFVQNFPKPFNCHGDI